MHSTHSWVACEFLLDFHHRFQDIIMWDCAFVHLGLKPAGTFYYK